MKYNLIHQSWKTKSIPAKYKHNRILNKKIFKDCEFKLWTDIDNFNFLKEKYPSFLKIYKNFNNKIHKIDSIRYFYLYEYGGLYADFDVIIYKNISKLINEDKLCLFSQDIKYESNNNPLKNNYDFFIDPMLMYSPPKNKEIKNVIDILYENKHNECNDIYTKMEKAGPIFLTKHFYYNKNIERIHNKVVTYDYKEKFSDVYGIHYCDNSWVNYE